jgi:hypothetical protein
VAPVPLTLKLHAGPGEVRKTIADGFDASISNAENVAFNLDGTTLAPLKTPAFNLNRTTDPNQTPSHLELTPSGGFGIAELQAPSGSLISSFASPNRASPDTRHPPADPAPFLNAESTSASPLHVTLVSPVSALKGNRYIVDGITTPKLPRGIVNDLQAEVKGAIPGASVTLDSAAPQAALKIWFQPTTDEVPLLQPTPPKESAGDETGDPAQEAGDPAQKSKGIPLSHLSLLLQGCVNPDLRIADKPATGVIADRSTDLKIDTISATLNTISIVPGSGKNDAPRLRVTGDAARASSLQQDQHELLPSLLGEAMDLPYAERGAVLILLGVVLFLLFKIMDRALGVLLEYIIPKV